jgi:peroxiredoxin
MTVRLCDEVPKPLAEVEVLDARGEVTRLGDRWADGPAALVFLRHFACLACTEHVTMLAPRLHELTRLGLRVVYVGNGAPNFIEGFVERNAVDVETVEVVTDPSLAAHQALDLPRSWWSTYGPQALAGLLRALLYGFRQGSIEGDNYQQGGVVVIDRQGRVAYLHRDRATGDHAPTGDVVQAAMRVAATGQGIA